MAVGTGRIASKKQFPWQTPVPCLVGGPQTAADWQAHHKYRNCPPPPPLFLSQTPPPWPNSQCRTPPPAVACGRAVMLSPELSLGTALPPLRPALGFGVKNGGAQPASILLRMSAVYESSAGRTPPGAVCAMEAPDVSPPSFPFRVLTCHPSSYTYQRLPSGPRWWAMATRDQCRRRRTRGGEPRPVPSRSPKCAITRALWRLLRNHFLPVFQAFPCPLRRLCADPSHCRTTHGASLEWRPHTVLMCLLGQG